MQFTVSSSLLNSQLQTLVKVINSKSSMPILDCFLFEVSNGKLVVTASDRENVMSAELPIDGCEGECIIGIPNRNILDAVKELDEQPLVIKVNTETMGVEVVYQNGKYQFVGQDGTVFPKAKELAPGATSLALDVHVLVDNVNRSLFATADDELRPVMGGVYFDLNADGLAIVATDGHKLVRNRNFTVKSDVPTSFILPKKPAAWLKTMLAKAEGEVQISYDANNACFATADAKLICRLIEGRYPNYNSVIPQNNPNKLTVDRKSCVSALRRVLPFASRSTNLVRLHIEEGKLAISTNDIDFATSANESLPCDFVGKTMDIGFNGLSLYEVLSNIDSEEVTFSLADPSRAGVIEPASQPENEDVLMLVMPMLLND